MGRRDWNHFKTDLIGGINQEIDTATPQECADARNVWAPNGYVERRPGYLYIYRTTFSLSGLKEADDLNLASDREVYDATTVLWIAQPFPDQSDINENGDIFYVKMEADYSSPNTAVAQIVGISQTVTTSPTTAQSFLLQYYDGTSWVSIPCMHMFVDTSSVKEFYGSNLYYDTNGDPTADGYFVFCLPDDVANSEAGSGNNTAGWIRFFLHGTLTGIGTTSTDDIHTLTVSNATSFGTGMHSAAVELQFLTGARYIFFGRRGASGQSKLTMLDGLPPTSGASWDFDEDDRRTFTWVHDEQATVAFIPQFNEAYISYSGELLYIDGDQAWDANPTFAASVETSDAYVGSGAAFDKDTVSLLGAIPQGRYITYFQNRIWAAGIVGEPYTIRWSAATPYHKVWPESAFEYLMEDDKSEIMGIKPLGENLIIFKRDSIWQMVFTDVDTFGVARYTPVRVVSGIGCVSNSSIQQIRGRLVFLGEDGVYSFDGVNVIKVTEKSGYDRLRQFIDTINKDKFAVSVHWQAKSCYLLSVSTPTSVEGNNNTVNDHVLVWDYVHDSWWIWDNIQVMNWLRVEGIGDLEEIYFVDFYGRVGQLSDVDHDNFGAITSYIKSQRINYESNVKHTVRQVEITAQNDNDTMTVEVLTNDEASGSSAAMNFKDTRTESQFGVAQFEVDSFATRRTRARRLNYRKTSDHSQVKITSATKNAPFILRNVDVAFVPLGRR